MMLLTLIYSLALPLVALGTAVNSHADSGFSDQLARREPGEVDLYKRFDNSQWTPYDVGLGACGVYSQPSDFVVALNARQFGGGFPGPNCFKTIEMTYHGKKTRAQIVDSCPSCPYAGLQLSRGLFRFFAPESAGLIHGTWNFIAG